MSNTDPKPGGWSTNVLLTSAQMNLVRAGVNAAVCRSGTTDFTGSTNLRCGGHVVQFTASDNAASQYVFEVGDEDLEINCVGAGGVAMVADRLKLSGAAYPILTGGRTVYMDVRWPAFSSTVTTGDWYSEFFFYTQHNQLTNIGWALPVLHGAILTEVTVTCLGGTFAALPATKPQLLIYKLTHGTWVAAQIGTTTTDASGTAGAFNAAHDLTVTGLNQPIDTENGDQYAVGLNGCGGAGFEPDKFRVVRVRAKYTIGYLIPGGG